MSPETINILIIGLVVLLAIFVAFMSLVISLFSRDDVNERLETYAQIPEEATLGIGDRRRVRLMRLRLRMNSMLSIFTSDELNLRLLSANWPITETEFVLIRIASTIAGLVIGWLIFGSLLVGLGFAIIAFLIPNILLQRSTHQRRSKFERQLVDVLVLVNGAVRAGYSILQALDVVVQEMLPPASVEFKRVRREVSLGLPLNQALSNLHERMQNDDLYLVVTAVNINTQVGGNLTTMLEAVTETIRERVRLFSEVRALTSQQRYSSYLLTLLPFIVAAILFIINPDYISRIFQPGPILCIPIGALVLVIIGNIVIRLISRIDY
jgi:tight adherence protein B